MNIYILLYRIYIVYYYYKIFVLKTNILLNIQYTFYIKYMHIHIINKYSYLYTYI